MIEEHNRIVLTADLPEEGLRAGDVGTVVHVHQDGQAFEVEFLTLDGRTVVVATVQGAQVRAVSETDMTHARPLAGT